MNSDNMTATEKVIEYFKCKVLEGEWNVGDRLPTEPELCDLIGVGRSGIREAMKVLESSHIIDIRRGDGTYISDPDRISFTEPLLLKVVLKESRMQELIGFRESIEMAVMRLAISNADENDIHALEQCNGKLKEYIILEKDDPEELFELDMSFHKTLAQAMHNTVMSDVYTFTFDIFRAVISQNYKNGQDAESALDDHLEITEAIKNKDFLYMGYAIKKAAKLWGTWGAREKISDYLRKNNVKI